MEVLRTHFSNQMPKLSKYIFITLIAGNVFVFWIIWSALGGAEDLAIHFLDVGQGDASLIETPAGNVLIDGGPSGRRVVAEIDKFLDYPDRTIDVVVMSHPNQDHIAGFVEVLKRYNVRLFVMSGVKYDTLASYQEIKRILQEKHIPILYAVAGEEFLLGGPKMKVLWPREPLKDKYFPRKALNDTSIVARLSQDDFDALFTGDISAKVEERLASTVGDIGVLKVAHHGSKYSSDIRFLRAVQPEIAAIGVGRNSYGHPAQETLDRLAAVGAKVLRTDLGGPVSIVINNGVVKITAKE